MKLLLSLSLLVTAPLSSLLASGWTSYGHVSLAPLSAQASGINEPAFVVGIPEKVNAGDYWSGVRKNYAPPKSANKIKWRLRSSFDGNVTAKITNPNDTDRYITLTLIRDWKEFEINLGIPGAYERNAETGVGSLEIIFHSEHLRSNPDAKIAFTEPRFEEMITPSYVNDFWMPNREYSAIPGYRIETCIHNIWPRGDAEFGGLTHPQSERHGLELALDISNRLKEEYGNVGITLAYIRGEAGQRFTAALESAGILPMSEGHNFPGDKYLDEHDAWLRDENGKTPVERGSPIRIHGEDPAHPATLAAVQEKMLNSAKAGAKVWRTVDYVSHHWGGAVWGFSEASIKRWRENLNNTDTGILSGKGQEHRRYSFWDYFESYFGYVMQPADCGIASWDDYSPPRSTETKDGAWLNRQTLYSLLFHYEWVKFINEAARPAGEYGLKTQPILNPESYPNGTDAYWLLAADNVRGFATEWWAGADAIVNTYYNAGYYQRQADRFGKELIMLGESAAAGGNPWGRPNYWDNQANYLITYAQAASFDAKAKHDQYWGSSWAKMSNPDNPEYQSYTAFRSAWGGFLQSKEDRALKARTRVATLAMRPIMAPFAPFDRSFKDQPYNLARHLASGNFNHDGLSLPLSSEWLEDYDILVHSAFLPPRGFAETLAEWLNKKPGRTLITHGMIPTRVAAPYRQGGENITTPYLQASGEETKLGLGRIAAGSVSSGRLRSNDPTLSRHLQGLLGETFSFSDPLYTLSGRGGKVLAMLGDTPLISEWSQGQSRVIYLHFNANERGQQRGDAERRLVEAVMRYVGEEPVAITPEGYYTMKFTTSAGDAFVTFNSKSNIDYLHKGTPCKVFTAKGEESKGEVRINTGSPRTRFKIINLIDSREQEVVSDQQGYASVSLNGWNLLGFRVEKIGPASR